MGKIATGALGAAAALLVFGYGEERSEPGSSADTYAAIATTGGNLLQSTGTLAVTTVDVGGEVVGAGASGLQALVEPMVAWQKPPQDEGTAGLPAGTAPAAEAGQ